MFRIGLKCVEIGAKTSFHLAEEVVLMDVQPQSGGNLEPSKKLHISPFSSLTL
jgi:hypothetical protein